MLMKQWEILNRRQSLLASLVEASPVYHRTIVSEAGPGADEIVICRIPSVANVLDLETLTLGSTLGIKEMAAIKTAIDRAVRPDPVRPGRSGQWPVAEAKWPQVAVPGAQILSTATTPTCLPLPGRDD